MGLDDNPVVYTIDFNRALDFCVWVLQQDGLQAAPFDRHADGDGSLRALGLDPTLWRAWVNEVAAGVERRARYQAEVDLRMQASADEQQRELQEYAREVQDRSFPAVRMILRLVRELKEAARHRKRPNDLPFPQPVELWPGTQALHDRLWVMFDTCKRDWCARRGRHWKSQKLRMYLISPRFEAFVVSVRALREDVLHPILVCFVNYPGPVTYAASESIVMIGAKNWDVDGAEFEQVVGEALDNCLGLTLRP